MLKFLQDTAWVPLGKHLGCIHIALSFASDYTRLPISAVLIPCRVHIAHFAPGGSERTYAIKAF